MLLVRASSGLAVAEARVETDVLGHALVGVEAQLADVPPPGLVFGQGHEAPSEAAALVFRGAGVVSAAGLATGSLVHVVAAAYGLSVIFQVSATAYTLLKVAGAAYLIWLGIGYLRRGPSTFRESALVEALNPKTALFFLALLPQFVEVAAGPVVPQVLLLGLIVTLTAIPCDLLIAFASGSLAKVLLRRPIYGRIQDWVAGSLLIALGVWVAVSRRAA